MGRHQLPVYSPISAGAVLGGARAAVGREAVLRALSERLAARFRAAEATLFDSGTHALQAALLGAIAAGRDPVALPAYSCYDIATAAVGARATAVFYDVDPRTLAPDLESLRRALSRGVRCVVVSPLLGYPVDWPALVALCASQGALLVEDAAQAIGSSSHGRPAGTWGDLTVLSFGRGKGWTGGGGGALLNRTEDVRPTAPAGGAARGREVRSVVVTAVQWALGRPLLFGIPSAIPFLSLGETTYREPSLPGPITRASAAIILANEGRIGAEVAARRSAARAYRLALDEATGQGRPAWEAIHPIEEIPNTEPGYLRFAFRRRGGFEALPSRDRLHRLGVRGGYPRPLTDLPAMGTADRVGPLPGSRELAATLITAPTHSFTTERDRLEVAERLLGRGVPRARGGHALGGAK